MRISIVTSFFLPVPPVRGGSTEKAWFALAGEFARRGHEVTFLSRRWPGFADRERAGGVEHVRLPGGRLSSRLALNLARDFIWGLRVARALPPADAVICNTVILPAWLRRLKPSAGRVVAVIGRMPKGQGKAYGRVDRFFATSPAVSARLAAENPSLAPRIRIVPCPIDWERQAAAVAKAETGPLRIGYVGRLHPEKGIDLLLAAAGLLAGRPGLPEWRLELIGPADVAGGGGGEAWFDGLRRRFGPALGERLEIRGAVYDAGQLARAYGAFDIFCYPSVAEQGETFGVSVAEAMAARCAPVVSALAAFGSLVRDGDTGIVFAHDGAGAERRLADALDRLLRDRPGREAMARRAQDHARGFDRGAVALQIEKELESLRETRD